jgi:hypothetical protein
VELLNWVVRNHSRIWDCVIMHERALQFWRFDAFLWQHLYMLPHLPQLERQIFNSFWSYKEPALLILLGSLCRIA